MLDINPDIQVDTYNEPFTSANAMRIAADYDVIIDGTDNFPTRYLTNDVCVLLGKPNVYGSIFRFDGQVSVFDARNGPCYRCLFPEPPPPGLVPSCAEGGVLGVLPGTIGTLQATEAAQADPGHRAAAHRARCCSTTPWICPSSSSSCARTPTARSADRSRK